MLKPTVTTPEQILALCREANHSTNCIGLVTWMHTFSPAKMWIGGLSVLEKPFMQLHTQLNREIPWDTMDMDFMNLTQCARRPRVRLHRRPHAQAVQRRRWPLADKGVQNKIDQWIRVAVGVREPQPEGRALWRQYARSGRDRRRQGRRADQVRLLVSTATRWAISKRACSP